MIRYRPKLLFFMGRFEAGLEVSVSSQGLIHSIGKISPPGEASTEAGEQIVNLPNEALIPGLCNVHSHAFQRALRGFAQKRGPKGKEDFWTWRGVMYRIADQLAPEDVYWISLLAFFEMLSVGMTTVGEFHYLHHQPHGKPYADPNELGVQVLRAARDAGMRICLLDSAYARGGKGREAEGAQKRFCDASVEAYLKRLEDLPRHLTGEQTLGLAPHSVRALPGDWLTEIERFNRKRALPLHMHVQEQPREIEECKREHKGKTPLALLADLGLLRQDFTAVHATHTSTADKNLLQRHRVRVCACPTTERDLGDGILQVDDLLERRVAICLGTDSQVNLNLFEDARQLEYHQRLETLSRLVISKDPAKELFRMMTLEGAKALGVAAGELKPGRLADFVTLDLDDPSLAGAAPESLLTHLVFSSQTTAISQVVVGGRLRWNREGGSRGDLWRQAVQKTSALVIKLL